jgi:hypothetical protein
MSGSRTSPLADNIKATERMLRENRRKNLVRIEETPREDI